MILFEMKIFFSQRNRCSDATVDDKRRITRSIDPSDEVTDAELKFRVVPYKRPANSTLYELKNMTTLSHSQETILFVFLMVFFILFSCILLICLSYHRKR